MFRCVLNGRGSKKAFRNVQVIVSPGSTTSVTVFSITSTTAPASPTQPITFRFHRTGTVSVTVFVPKPMPDTVNVRRSGSAGSVSSSTLNGPKLPVKPKSWGPFGTASLTMVTVASLVLVNVQTMVSPALTVKLTPLVMVVAVVPVQVTWVSDQPGGT